MERFKTGRLFPHSLLLLGPLLLVPVLPGLLSFLVGVGVLCVQGGMTFLTHRLSPRLVTCERQRLIKAGQTLAGRVATLVVEGVGRRPHRVLLTDTSSRPLLVANLVISKVTYINQQCCIRICSTRSKKLRHTWWCSGPERNVLRGDVI